MAVPINKAKIRRRLDELGKLSEFHAVRERYKVDFKGQGFDEVASAHKAWEEAVKVFLEPDHWTPKVDPRAIVEQFHEAGGVQVVDPQASKPEELAVSKDDAPLSMFKGKKRSNPRKDILWVYENLHTRGVKPSDAPSSGAWGMLVWAKRTTANETSFVTQLLKPLIAKEDDDREQLLDDDGRAAEEIIAEIRRLGPNAVHSPGSEDMGGEPSVPTEHAPARVEQ